MKEVFATAAPAFVKASLKQLIEACELPGEAKGTTISVSAGLEIIASLEPETEAQAALAIHIACLHAATINVLGRTSIVLDRNLIAMTTSAAKLERAFQLALETYDRLKHGSRQVVRVERVDIHAGGQAVVSVVQQRSAR